MQPHALAANGQPRSANVLRRFVDDVGGAVHAARTLNHLVSLGTIRRGNCRAANEQYLYLQLSAGHRPLRVSADHDQATQPLPGDQWNGLGVRIAQCNAIGKPLFIGELGVVAARRRRRQRRAIDDHHRDAPAPRDASSRRKRPLRHRRERAAQRGDPCQGATARHRRRPATAAAPAHRHRRSTTRRRPTVRADFRNPARWSSCRASCGASMVGGERRPTQHFDGLRSLTLTLHAAVGSGPPARRCADD